MKQWQTSLVEEWNSRQANAPASASVFPLVEQNFEASEIIAMTEVLLSGQLTMSHRVKEFEMQFAAYAKSNYAVMVNSGSSANLLALAVACNPLRKKHFKAGDEVLVPAVCWSTSVWPIIQMGLKPVFVDVDPQTLNVDISDLRKKGASESVKGMMAVHILGNCGPMEEVMAFARERDWIVIEDTCESLGSTWNEKVLGTIGDFGTYSFYFSHHMTTGEGGMVVCKTQEDADLLKCLRAHGWTRELSNRQEIENKFDHVDPRFLFVNVGYNFRPMEIQAALGIEQLKKLPTMNENRIYNRNALVAAIQKHPSYKDQFEFPVEPQGAKAVWFGFPAVLKDTVKMSLRDYLQALSKAGVENRPVVSGNFARQPALDLFKHPVRWQELHGAEKLHQRGFFIGLHSQKLSAEKISQLADILVSNLG